ncbi:MAG: cellulose synthase operon protein YhjQ/BcsQ [Paracoccaceae bacterium]
MIRKATPEIVTFPKADKDAPRIAAYLSDTETERHLRDLFGKWGYATGHLKKGGIQEAIRDYAAAEMPPVLIVDISGAALPLSDLQALADICPPQVNVVALGRRDDVGIYRDLMDIGVTDYLVKPVPGELLHRALRRASGQAVTRQADQRTGKTVAVYGVRGGVGATTTVASMGWLLAKHFNRHVMMVDLNLAHGSLALDLGQEAGGGLAELLASPDRIDEMVVDRATLAVGEKLRLLAGEDRLPVARDYDAAAVSGLMGHLLHRYHFILQDIDRTRHATARALLEKADVRILVMDATLAAVRDTARLVSELGEGDAAKEIRIVLNRSRGVSAGEVPTDRIAEVIGRAVDIVIPFDRKRLALARLNGEAAMVKKSAARNAYLRLAATLIGQRDPPSRRARWFASQKER